MMIFLRAGLNERQSVLANSRKNTGNIFVARLLFEFYALEILGKMVKAIQPSSFAAGSKIKFNFFIQSTFSAHVQKSNKA